jgi:hypothetical protein
MKPSTKATLNFGESHVFTTLAIYLNCEYDRRGPKRGSNSEERHYERIPINDGWYDEGSPSRSYPSSEM